MQLLLCGQFIRGTSSLFVLGLPSIVPSVTAQSSGELRYFLGNRVLSLFSRTCRPPTCTVVLGFPSTLRLLPRRLCFVA
ncbi:hypothetical protein J3E68DRAFT_80080 [Trichoderma sp. SZMC 28012]